MTEIEILARDYPGDDAWQRFVSAYDSPQREDLPKLSLDIDILQVTTNYFGNSQKAENWLQKELPPLGGASVVEVFGDEVSGRNIVRHLLMRLP